MKKIILVISLFVSKTIANPTSGWNEDYSYEDYPDTGWSLSGDPIFWGLVLFFGIMILIGQIKDWIKPDPMSIKTTKGQEIGCFIPTVVMVVLGILFFVN